MDPRFMQQRHLAKRRSARIWGAIAGALWLVIVGALVFQQDPGANIGAGMLAFLAIPASIVALAEFSESRYADPSVTGRARPRSRTDGRLDSCDCALIPASADTWGGG